ncbi:MAG: restriction endonuclease subunit S [Dolichospermum sp.]
MEINIKDGYKVTEVGVIPDDWEVKKLGDIFEFKNGLNKEKKFFGAGTPIVNYMDVYKNRGLTEKHLKGRVTVTEQEIKTYEVRENDVFFTRTSETVEEIGISSVIIDNVQNTVFSGFILRARPKNHDLINSYKQYCFSSQIIRSQIISTSSYTTRALTNGKLLSNIIISIPPLAEQKAIAHALSDVDNLITAIDQLIIKKRNIKQGTMQELLTGKKRLPGFSGKWEVKKLGDIAAIRKQKIDSKKVVSQLFCVELEHIDQGSGRLLGYTETTNKSSIKNVFYKNDILFGKLRAYLRKYWFASTNGVCSTEIWPFVVVPDILLPEYLYFCIQTDKFIETASMAYGTHMPRSDWNVITNYYIPLPPLPEQKAIAEILTDIDKEIEALEKKRDKYKAIKQGMMQELLTGKTRIIDN